MCLQDGLLDTFERCFASQEIHLAKPDVAAFRYVLQQLSCDPHRIVFFDDRADNIAAAKSVGIHAVQVESFADLSKKIALLGLMEE